MPDDTLVDTEVLGATLWEAKYSADQLRQMLAKGQAIKNDYGEPSYPIADEEDLRKAIRAVGRGGTSHSKIRAHIIKRAKALGKTDMLPDNWGSSGAMKEATQFTESIPLAEASAVQVSGARMRIKLVDRGWGSSGFYSESVLRQAADDQIWAAGSHMYMDHPTASEGVERPERSVRDLAAVLTSPARFEDGALYAEARVFSPYQPVLNEMRDHIGVSIRASGLAEHGEAEGREGTIIIALTEGISVDFVTRAGRGGRIVEVLESARREMAESGDGPSVRDEHNALHDGPPVPSETPAPAAEHNTPAPPAQPLEENRMSGSTQPGTPPSGDAQTTEVSEAAVRTELAETKQKLAEAELEIAKFGENQRELEDTKAKLAEAEATNLRLQANNTARDKALKTLAESTLPKVAHARVIEAVTGDNVPLNEEGSLDEAALVKNIKAAIEDQRGYLTAFAEESGLGQVTGLGGSSEPPVNVESELGDVFASLGMSEAAAKSAAQGRR